MKKLSKAQERELERIQRNYTGELEDEISYYTKRIENYDATKDYFPISYYEEHLEKCKAGYILWNSRNSRTLEILAERGLIEYVKTDTIRSFPLDWVKLP